MFGDNNDWVQCPMCGGEGLMAEAVVPTAFGEQHAFMVCVWCNGQGAVDPGFADYIVQNKMERVKAQEQEMEQELRLVKAIDISLTAHQPHPVLN